jgi:hypothetical protein
MLAVTDCPTDTAPKLSVPGDTVKPLLPTIAPQPESSAAQQLVIKTTSHAARADPRRLRCQACPGRLPGKKQGK